MPGVPEQGQRRLVAPELDPDLGEDPVGLSLDVAECPNVLQRSRNWRFAADFAGAGGLDVTEILVIFIFVLLSRGEQHPQCAIRVVEAFSSTIPAMMQSAHVDVAIVTGTHPHVGLETNLLAQEEFFLVGRAGDAIVAVPEMTLRDVDELPLLLPGSSGGIRRVLDQVIAEQGVAMNVAGPWRVSVGSLARTQPE